MLIKIRNNKKKRTEEEDRTNTAKSVKHRNECNEGIVIQAHVFVNDVNILNVF